ncbi:MAG: ABC transporter ATP-binding protein [Betaproteobacteria bacterium]|nr:ABC transporter ATP-binding protein [Betaproteobacteria bacterium]NDB41107.1 ABC transporter ATP-binding protein [Betaproteobacteria bacterium]NDC98831.1 ABC transporter ATP-binding protein [Betaproteobacteria bacterium]
MLELQQLSRHFGGVKALDQLSFEVRAGDIHGLIGPNGSGKSTTVNLISGVYRPTSGLVKFKGKDLGDLETDRRVHLGISRTFQNIRLFGNLTVWQNIWAARVVRSEGLKGFRERWLSGASRAKEDAELLLSFGGLEDKRDVLASNLAFGEQRRLELIRAAASGSDLLLLDEPAAGMNAEEINDLELRIRELRKLGRTILLIEHHMELVMSVCDCITVLNFGRKIAEGMPGEIQQMPEVKAAYLGSDLPTAA